MDQILAEEAVDDGTADLVQWTLTDHLNTVRDIAKYDPGTNMTTVVNHLVYDAFGRVTSERNPAVDSLFLFTARPFDPDTGLQNNLNRWYDASVRRWLSEDPIAFAGGDGNLYRYVGNGVLTGVDADGLEGNPRHHWFMAYHDRPGFGQGQVDAICRIPHIDINRYTTEYTREEHAFFRQWLSGEVNPGPIYQTMYESLLNSSKDCCRFLIGMKALMRAWHSAIRFAQLQQGLPGRVKPFDLIDYRDRHDPPASTYWEFNKKIQEACGCSSEQVDGIEHDVFQRQLEFLKRIKHDLGLVPPGLGEQILDILRHPVAVPAPLPVWPGPGIPIPKPVPLY